MFSGTTTSRRSESAMNVWHANQPLISLLHESTRLISTVGFVTGNERFFCTLLCPSFTIIAVLYEWRKYF
jgi:hypothetical protein